VNRLVVGNLLHRPLRAVIGIFAIAIEVLMILSIVGFLMGQLNGARNSASGIGADMMVRPPNASFISGVGGAPVFAKTASVLAKLPHVAVAAPIVADFHMGDAVETLYGIDFDSFNALRPFKFLAGGPFKGPNDLIVDDFYARSDNGHHVGEQVKLIDKQVFTICGIVEHGKGGRKFVPIQTLSTIVAGQPDKASLFYIRSDDAKSEELIRKEILATPGLQQYQVQTLEEYLSLMSPSHLPAFKPALIAVISIAVIVGFIAIFQSMYTAIMERTREIGILKSLGASKLYIIDAVLRETALLAVVGGILGVVLTFAIQAYMNARFPTIPFPIERAWILETLLLAFAGSLLGAVYPAMKAAYKDPIDALAYE
jgi:putative ABC transport system permease protein